MRKNILLLVPNLNLGGQQQVLLRTADILKDEYNIFIAVLTMKDSVYEVNYNVIDLNIPAGKGLVMKVVNVFRRVIKTKKLKRELKIDVSISFGSTANIQNVFSKANDRIIASVHGYESIINSISGKIWGHILYSKADAMVCVSKNMSNELASLYRVDNSKIFTVNNPYNLEELYNKSKEDIEGFSFSFPTIVTMGRIDKVKGYWHLIKAFSLVQDKHPEARLLFIGDGKDMHKLDGLVKKLNLSSSVIFAGFQKNPLKYLSKGDIFVMSSIHEGFPNAMVEAMICGLPVISTDCKTGPREILTKDNLYKVADEIEYGDFGVLVPPANGQENYRADYIEKSDHFLADAINNLIEDPLLYKKYKDISQKRATDFSYTNYYKKMKNIIEV